MKIKRINLGLWITEKNESSFKLIIELISPLLKEGKDIPSELIVKLLTLLNQEKESSLIHNTILSVLEIWIPDHEKLKAEITKFKSFFNSYAKQKTTYNLEKNKSTLNKKSDIIRSIENDQPLNHFFLSLYTGLQLQNRKYNRKVTVEDRAEIVDKVIKFIESTLIEGSFLTTLYPRERFSLSTPQTYLITGYIVNNYICPLVVKSSKPETWINSIKTILRYHNK